MNYKKPNQFCNNEKHPVAILGGGIFFFTNYFYSKKPLINYAN